MRDWELAEHFAERDGVRMSSGQHIDTPREGPIPAEMVGRWDSLVAKNKRLREALVEATTLARRMAFGGVVVGYEIREFLDRAAALLGEGE